MIALPYPERAALSLAAHDSMTPLGTREAIASLDVDAAACSVVRSWRLPGARFLPHALSLLPMHYGKGRFARRAAGQLPTDHAVLGFPGASLELFQRSTGPRILHAVDAHPREHNRHLIEHFGRSLGRAEIYPDWLVRRIEAELRLADIVLVPSRLVERQMTTHGVERERIVMVPYGVDFDTFAPREPAPRAAGRPRLLFVGQLSLRKGIPHLLAAARDLDVDIRLVGRAFDRSGLRHLPSNVAVIAPRSHTELAREYALADAFLLPTIEDACALVTFEAAAAGLPIVTTRMNGAAERLADYPVQYVEPGDVDDLASAMGAAQPLERGDRIGNAEMARTIVADWSSYADLVRGALGERGA